MIKIENLKYDSEFVSKLGNNKLARIILSTLLEIEEEELNKLRFELADIHHKRISMIGIDPSPDTVDENGNVNPVLVELHEKKDEEETKRMYELTELMMPRCNRVEQLKDLILDLTNEIEQQNRKLEQHKAIKKQDNRVPEQKAWMAKVLEWKKEEKKRKSEELDRKLIKTVRLMIATGMELDEIVSVFSAAHD